MRQLVTSPRLLLVVGCALLAGAGALVAAERSSSAMAGAANAFLASLTPEQRQQAVFPFESDERMRWHFIPTEGFPRKGLTVKEMTDGISSTPAASAIPSASSAYVMVTAVTISAPASR